MEKNKIEDAIEAINDVLFAPAETIEEKNGKLDRLTILTALAAEAQSSACALYKLERGKAVRRIAEEKYPASQTVIIAEGEVSEYAGMYEHTQRLSAAISYSIEAIRSQMSLYKTELTNSLIQK